MDSEEKKELSAEEESEDDSSLPDLEFSDSWETRATSASERGAEETLSTVNSPRNIAAAEFPEAPHSLETEGACNIPVPGPYTSLIKRRRELYFGEKSEAEQRNSYSQALHSHSASGVLKASRESDNTFKRFDSEPISLPQRHGYDSLKENTDEKREDGRVECSSTASSKITSETYSPEPEGACGISEPSLSEAHLIQMYKDFNLMENIRRERALDRADERSPRRIATAYRYEPSPRSSEGASGLPGPFASFIQRHRDINLSDDSDEEQLEDRPVWPLERRQRAISASYRDSRSLSLGECSEESMSRSTSEASQSSGLQEAKEASASDSSLLQQPHQRELNLPGDEAANEDGDTDEDEADLETEENYQDSDSERRGYSL